MVVFLEKVFGVMNKGRVRFGLAFLFWERGEVDC